MTRIRKRRFAAVLLLFAVATALGDRVLATPSRERAPAAEYRSPRGMLPEDPAVANLDPALRAALRRATADAADEGVQLLVRSGWRSPADQQRLLDEAVSQYGSPAEAARWVAPPERSAHVSGDAIDVGPAAVATWLAARGAEYGLCRIYANEPWHFELRPRAADRGCPPLYPDPTYDPRLRP